MVLIKEPLACNQSFYLNLPHSPEEKFWNEFVEAYNGRGKSIKTQSKEKRKKYCVSARTDGLI